MMAPDPGQHLCLAQLQKELEPMLLRVWPWLLAMLASAALAEPLRIGFGTHKPPYVFEGENRGLEYDIVAAAVRAAGDSLEVHYAPQERLHLALGRGELDGIATTNAYSGIRAHYSAPY